MKFSSFLLIFPFVFIIGISCSVLQDLASIKKPSLSVSDVKISEISLQDLELTFDVDVDNPNAVAINLASYDFDFLIDQNSFVKGSQPLSTEIGSSGNSTIQIPVKFTFKELYQTFSSIQDKDETAYNFDASIGVSLPVLGLTEIPISKSGTFPVVKTPSISASKLTVKNLSFTKADLELQIDISNPNAFGIILNALNYNVDINGLESISGITSESVEIVEKGVSTVKIPVSFNLIELGRTAYQLLSSNKELDYSLSGTTNIDATLPFFNASSYDFNKSGSLNLFK
jgi:LEA14-like dessication related protein